ncbi:glycosyltransferase family 4 protein [bacterium]|nr:glycosyltransferase family 4 protein [bacterium]
MLKNKNILIITSSLESGVIDKSVIDIATILNEKDFNITVISAGGKMVKELKKCGIEHIQLPINSNDFFVIRRNMKKISEISSERQISMIHTFTPQSSFYGFKISKIFNIPYITSFLKIYKKSFWHLTNNRINYLTKGDIIIVPSDFMASFIQITYKVPSEKIAIIPQWIDTDVYNSNNVSAERIISTASDLRIPEDHFIITTIAKMEKTRGQTNLITAISKLPNEIKQRIRCLIIGSYKEHKRYKNELTNLSQKLGVEGIIHIAGDCSDTPALLMLSDVYIATNIEPKASQITVLEAQSIGRPIIASNIGSTSEYILDNDTCKTYDPRNIDELVKAILWSMEINEDKREEISKKLSANIRLNFSKNLLPQKIGSIYDYVLEKK